MQNVSKEKSFIRYLTDADLLDVALVLDGKRVSAFVVNYRARIGDGWHEVVRYDNAHGRPLHIHRYWPPFDGAKDYLEPETRTDYTDALNEALLDLDDNWTHYRKQVEAHAQPPDQEE